MRWKLDRASRRMIAQSGTELAVFGAILLFVIGSIFRVGLSATHQVNQKLKAFRLALGESYRTMSGQYNANSAISGLRISSARNTASVLILEDRLAVSPLSRQGPIDRNPLIQMGQGTFTNLVMYPIDWGEFHTLPVVDIIVNGQRFVFSVGKWKILRPQDAFDNGDIPLCQPGVTRGYCWEPNCIGPQPYAPCLLMYKLNTNFIKNKDWCWDVDMPEPGCHADNIPLDRRFDLDFDLATDVGTPEERQLFAWQWLLVPGVNHKSVANLNYAVMDGATQGVEGIWTDRHDEDQDVINTSVDLDGDLFEELIFEVDFGPKGEITEIRYLDYQEGDFDLGVDNRSKSRGQWTYVGPSAIGNCSGPPPVTACKVGVDPNIFAWVPNSLSTCAEWECTTLKPGLLDELQMYSFTKDGTLFRVKEGNFLTEGRFMRNRNIVDHVDIVMRTIQLSSDTDRFCDANGNPTVWSGNTSIMNYTSGRFINPVEACNDCFAQSHIELTCMDEGLKQIYVRSRIQNLIGHKWLTRFRKPTGSQ